MERILYIINNTLLISAFEGGIFSCYRKEKLSFKEEKYYITLPQ